MSNSYEYFIEISDITVLLVFIFFYKIVLKETCQRDSITLLSLPNLQLEGSGVVEELKI